MATNGRALARRRMVLGRMCSRCGETDAEALWGQGAEECAACERRRGRNGLCARCGDIRWTWAGKKRCGACQEGELSEAETISEKRLAEAPALGRPSEIMAARMVASRLGRLVLSLVGKGASPKKVVSETGMDLSELRAMLGECFGLAVIRKERAA